MPPERVAPPAPWQAPGRASIGALALLIACLASACTSGMFAHDRLSPDTTPVVDKAATSCLMLTEYVQLLQKLVQGTPSDQAEIVATAQHEYETAPTPSRELRLALILATPGHPATDRLRAQHLLQELMANPETLVPGERSLAFLELQQIDDHLTLEQENRRLQTDTIRADRERVAALSHRLQQEADENRTLRRELDEARAKLDAIETIERSLNERKPSNEARPQ
jgi:hypothetical protein